MGKDHAKFQPVATAYFQYVPRIRINQNLFAQLTPEQKQEFCDSDPNGSFKINDLTGQLEVPDPETYAYDEECLKKAEELGKPGLMDVERLDEYVFKVETVGQLTPEETIESMFECITGKLKTLLNHVNSVGVVDEDMELDL